MKSLFLVICCVFAMMSFAADQNAEPADEKIPAAQEANNVPQQSVQPIRRDTTPPYSTASLAGQVVTGLLLVLGLIIMIAWLAKKLGYGNFQAQGHIRLLASLPLGAREKAVLVEVHGQQLLLGVAPGRVSFLQEVEPADTASADHTGFVRADAAVSKGQDFAGYLKTLLSQGKNRA